MTSDDLFPGFESRFVAAPAGTIYARVGGSGPPLCLLHGYPQTHAEWHRIAPRLAERFTVVAMDLRGYGRSSVPESSAGEAYTKRAMGEDVRAVMAALGFGRFTLVGHDRGARVAYRLALDTPEALDGVVVLDIIPTLAMWRGFDAKRALKTYHWPFLAQPEPLPETLIVGAADFMLDYTLASWTAARNLACFDPRAHADYRSAFRDPRRIHAFCEDYRAGATLDVAHDERDRSGGHRISVPLLCLWGSHGIPASGDDPLSIWREWAREVHGHVIESGHFLPEENPDSTVQALMSFL